MKWEGLRTGRRGRQQSYSDPAIQACLTLKVVFGFALRQTTGFVESLLRLAGLTWSVPNFSTLSRRQKVLTVDIPYRGSDGPLHLLIDSTVVSSAKLRYICSLKSEQKYVFTVSCALKFARH